MVIKLLTKSLPPPHPSLVHSIFVGTSLLGPSLPGKAIKLFISTSPKTLSLRGYWALLHRGQIFGINTTISSHPGNGDGLLSGLAPPHLASSNPFSILQPDATQAVPSWVPVLRGHPAAIPQTFSLSPAELLLPLPFLEHPFFEEGFSALQYWAVFP